jgi:transcriptional regulator with XRE-family HTH domain
MEIGKKIKVLRLLTGSGQLELAKYLGMKAATHVNRWEQGGAIPRTNMLQRLGDLLGVYWPWLQDSNSDFVKEAYVHFRPLSPFVPYTPRWLALLQRDVGDLLPALLQELKLQNVWGFQAPCKGGFVVATKPDLTLLITCLPGLYDSIVRALPSVYQVTISDSYYSKQLFLDELTQDLFDRCGVGHIELEKKAVPPPATNVNIVVKASAAADINHQDLRNTIQRHIDTIISAAGLFEADVTINVTASRNSKEIILDLVSDPALKKLALQLSDPME